MIYFTMFIMSMMLGLLIIRGQPMFELYVNNKVSLFEFLDLAKTIAKESGLWYYITDGIEVVWTQNDEILESLDET